MAFEQRGNILNRELSETSVIQQNPDVLDADLENETVLMSIESGTYFGMNETGSRIWALIETPMSIREISTILSSEYEISETDCLERVLGYCWLLLERDIITTS